MSSQRWLIAGLGNPGKQYEKTRHNVGFQVIHQLAKEYGIQAQTEKKWTAQAGTGHIAGHPVILLQPLTYMNCSGESIAKVLHFYQIPTTQLLVIYDDCAIPFGKLRIRPDGSAGGHNGIKSIIQCLGNQNNFPRIRVGIGAPSEEATLHNHVLSGFTASEMTALKNTLLPTCVQAIETVLTDNVETAMNRFNGMEIS